MRPIYEPQFGYQAKHSTHHALLSLTEKIRVSLDSRKFACGIFIDLQKAFDTIAHSILLRKPEHYGINGLANNRFRSYLSGWTLYKSVNGFDLEYGNMKYGVPQESVLGPLHMLAKIRHYCK